MIDRNALPPAVIDALRRGDKIGAIKLLREATKLGLAEAKGAIDALEAAKSGRPAPPSAAKPAKRVAVAHAHAQRRPREDDLGPGEEPHGSASAAATVMLLAAVALVVWFFLAK